MNVGDKVTVTGAAAGGTAPYTYSYLLHNKDTDSWSRLTPQFINSASFYMDSRKRRKQRVFCRGKG